MSDNSSNRPSPIMEFIKGTWWGLNLLRKLVINGLFLLIVIVVLLALQPEVPTPIQNNSVLHLKITGQIVEQKKHVPPAEKIAQAVSEEDMSEETLLSDILEAIDHARTDSRINAIILDTESLTGATVTQARAVYDALQTFKSSDKKIYAYTNAPTQMQYYILSAADKLTLNPEGGIFLEGLGSYRTYYKSLIDLIGINYHVFKVGTYKSAVEPYIRDDMSEAAKSVNQVWLDTLWSTIKRDILSTRDIGDEKFERYVNVFQDVLKENNGKLSSAALNYHLVDQVASKQVWLAGLEQQSVLSVMEQSLEEIDALIRFEDYLTRLDITKPKSPQKVALINAVGVISDGEQPAGTIGGETLSALIDEARRRDDIAALVLRVDSPGGSAFAAEQIRASLEAFQAIGKPYVVSMGSYAASGGYWISAGADKIWAHPTTITGSIGVFGLIPTFEKPLSKLGVSRDGVGTTTFSNAMDITKPLAPNVVDIFNQIVRTSYMDFLTLVAAGRNMTTQQVDEIGQGRVWDGEHALKNGLVDELGNLKSAIDDAAFLATLGDDYQVEVIEETLSAEEALIERFLTIASKWAPKASQRHESWLEKITAMLPLPPSWISDKPTIYAHCLCEAQ